MFGLHETPWFCQLRLVRGDSQRRYVFGGAHWSQLGSGRLGVVVTVEQSVQTSNSQLLGRRLLGQTQIQF
jgi:hypothetical protein